MKRKSNIEEIESKLKRINYFKILYGYEDVVIYSWVIGILYGYFPCDYKLKLCWVHIFKMRRIHNENAIRKGYTL